MKKKFQICFILFCVMVSGTAQLPDEVFIKKFLAADYKNKVKIAASKPYAEIKQLYPFMKDSLDKIRRIVFITPHRNSLKVLLDKIEAEIASDNNNEAKAIIILENALRNHATDIDDSLVCWQSLKIFFAKIRNYNKAIELQQLIDLKMFRKSPNLDIEFGFNRSSIYQQMGLYQKAVLERRKEFSNQKNPDTLKTINFYNDMGVFFNLLKESDSAEVYFLKAAKLFQKLRYSKDQEMFMLFYKALVGGNLGLTYYNKGNFEGARPLLLNDVYYSMKTGNYRSALSSYILLSQTSLKLHQNLLAKRYLDTASILVKKDTNAFNMRLKFLLASADYYYCMRDFYKASHEYRNYTEIQKRIALKENEQKLEDENVSTSLKQKEIEMSRKDNILRQLQLAEAKSKSSKAYLLIGIIVLSGIVIFLVVNNQNTKKREGQLALKNKQIISQKFLIEGSLKEKEVLIKEIHHRVKNNLQIITSLLSLQIGKVEDEKTETILRDAKQRISSIALTHQMLYQKKDLSNIHLGDYIEKLVREVEFIMPPSNIKLETEINVKESNLTIDNAVPLGLLVNELLTNAYKHAFPAGTNGKITVRLAETEESYILTVTDNGIGLPENFETTERKTLGIELVYILADQLNSTITVNKEQGSSFSLQIKKQNINS